MDDIEAHPRGFSTRLLGPGMGTKAFLDYLEEIVPHLGAKLHAGLKADAGSDTGKSAHQALVYLVEDLVRAREAFNNAAQAHSPMEALACSFFRLGYDLHLAEMLHLKEPVGKQKMTVTDAFLKIQDRSRQAAEAGKSMAKVAAQSKANTLAEALEIARDVLQKDPNASQDKIAKTLKAHLKDNVAEHERLIQLIRGWERSGDLPLPTRRNQRRSLP